MHRIQARRGNGRWTRNTLENTCGLHVIWCPSCGIGNPWSIEEQQPEACHACGAELKRPEPKSE